MQYSIVHRLAALFAVILILCPVLAFAEPDEPVSDQDLTAAGLMTDSELEGAVGFDTSGYTLVDGEVVAGAPAKSMSVGDVDLRYAPYIGSGWITGTVSGLGDVYVYVPITSKGSWGTTSGGYLCNVGSSTISGIMYSSNGTQYTFSCSSFAIPRYRRSDSSSYSYTDAYLTVSDSNLQIASEFPPAVTAPETYELILIGLMGVVILCLMRYRR